MVNFLEIDNFQVQQHREELDFILSKASGKTNYMEIGVYGGGTFNQVSKVTSGKHIVLDIEAKPERDEKLKQSVKNFHSVVGDSHKYETLEQVEKILDGELLEVLFIDGDHTAEGVKRDFEMYKHLVAEGGVILFHDIISSEFHRKHNCFVDVFWSAAPEPKDKLCVSKEWGGVGCIINRKMNWICYQIYYDNASKKGLRPCFKSYFNRDKEFFYFENRVIREIYEKLDKIDADYVGTTSWKFSEKTGIDSKLFPELIEATNCNYDVILFPLKKHLHDDCMQRSKVFFKQIYDLCLIFDKENILPFKMQSDKWTCSYNNYWIAKKSVYKDYCEKILIPAMDAFKNNQAVIEYIGKNKINHNSKLYPITPFLLEVLMGFYVNKLKIKHKIITPDTLRQLQPGECWCKVIDKSLVPEGTEYIKLKREFAERMKLSGSIEIMEKWK